MEDPYDLTKRLLTSQDSDPHRSLKILEERQRSVDVVL